MNKSAMPAHRTQMAPIGVALGVVNARRADGHGCALRLDWNPLRALLDHAEFIHTL
ncbi:MAG: hypothetical protein PHO64_13030 [Thiomonas sp.]|nr:hypothetical protein [Thiomonas sp.]